MYRKLGYVIKDLGLINNEKKNKKYIIELLKKKKQQQQQKQIKLLYISFVF